MNRQRRGLLAMGAWGFMGAPAVHAASRQRVVIVGGGWAGLAFARELEKEAGAFELCLIERAPHFVLHPLLNRAWVGQIGEAQLLRQRVLASGRQIEAEVESIDPAGQTVRTSKGDYAYDWLVLAPGIDEDWPSLTAGDAGAAATCRRQWDAGWAQAGLPQESRARLAGLSSGQVLMSVPPAPYRCPPAPYERALLLAGWFAEQGRDIHLTVVDPNAPWPALARAVRGPLAGRVSYLAQTRVQQIDAASQVAVFDVDELRFDTALLMPRQRAGLPCRMARVVGEDGWAAVDPLTFRSLADARIYVVGDSVGRVSPLFGHYPKTVQVAMAMGRAAARDIGERSRGGGGASEAVPLPPSLCLTQTSVAPPEWVEITARFGRRGDGLITQAVQQRRIPLPDGEPEAWLAAVCREAGVKSAPG